MEAVGVALAVPPLLLLCLDVLDRVENFRKYETHEHQLNARFCAVKIRLQRWSSAIGVSKDDLDSQHHECLRDPTIGSVLYNILSAIYAIFDDVTNVAQQLAQDNLGTVQVPSGWHPIQRTKFNFARLKESVQVKRNALSWALRGKRIFVEQVEMFDHLVDALYDLLPIDDATKDVAVDNLGAPEPTTDPKIEQIEEVLRDMKFRLSYLYQDAMSDMYKRIDEWLNVARADQEFEKYSSIRIESTCDWILVDEGYLEWQLDDPTDDKAKLFWVHAPPGFGKTVLCAALIAKIKQKSDRPVAYFFSSPYVQLGCHPHDILRSWISQLIRADNAVFDLVGEELVKDRTVPIATQNTIWNLLHKILSTIKRCTLVLDGFDEFPRVDDDRREFLQKLKKAVVSTSARILVMSRPQDDIESEISSSSRADDLIMIECQMTSSRVQEDIHRYTEKMVAERLPNKHVSLQEELTNKLCQRCDGQLLWIKLMRSQLSPGKSRKELLRIVEQTPHGLTQYYQRHWADIQNKSLSERNRAVAILRWACFATRPLTVEELTEALVHEPDVEGLCKENMPDEIDSYYVDSEIKELCLAFIDISRSPDSLASCKIQIIHPSAKEFLRETLPNPSQPLPQSREMPTDASHHVHLAESCLRYILCDGTWDSYSTENPSNQERFQTGLMDYAKDGWHDHVSQADGIMSEEYRRLTIRLFDHNGAIFSRWANNPGHRTVEWTKPRHETGVDAAVYLASFWGLPHVLEHLHDHHQIDFSPVTFTAGNALSAAASHGTDLFRKLLSWGADAHSRCGQHGSPLGAAVVAGNIDMVVKLLELKASTEVLDWEGKPVLALACQNDNIDIMQHLLDHGADPTGHFGVSCSPLFCAISNKNIAAAKILLDRGATLLSEGEGDCIDLYYACTQDCPELVELLLLQKGIDVNVANEGETPLHFAAFCGHRETVRLLLDHGANIECRTDGAQTPLHYASLAGNVETVRLLLDDGANLDCQDDGGSTPLHKASRFGETETARLLLDYGANLECQTNDGSTPLFYASRGNMIETVRLLIDRGANTECQIDSGLTLLHLVSQSDYTEVVRLLLDGRADMGCRNSDGLTPLHCASLSGRVGSARLLLTNGANPNCQDNSGFTPLHYASNRGHTEIVRILLSRGADANQESNEGSTPLHMAVLKDLAITQLLLKQGAKTTLQAGPEKCLYQPLHIAIETGQTAIARLLISTGAPLNFRARWGRTALQIAIKRGDLEMVKELVSAGADLNLVRGGGQTLLEDVIKSFPRDARVQHWKRTIRSDVSDTIRKLKTRENAYVLAQDLLNYVIPPIPHRAFYELYIDFQFLDALQDATFALQQRLMSKNEDGIFLHLNVSCDGCSSPGNHITGDRWVCFSCPDRDYCSSCKENLSTNENMRVRECSGHEMILVQGVLDERFSEEDGCYHQERVKDTVVRAWLEDVVKRYGDDTGAQTLTDAEDHGAEP